VLQSNRAKHHQRLVGVAVLIVSVFFACGIPFIDGQTGYAGLSPRFLPSVVALGLAICGLAMLLGRDTIQIVPLEKSTTLDSYHRFKRLAIIIAGLLAHLLLIGSIGFVLASALLLATTAKAYGSTQLLRNALLGLAVSLTIWLIFTQLLGLNLPLLPLLATFKP
jgi:putative tricarboxylic transport membrane protein